MYRVTIMIYGHYTIGFEQWALYMGWRYTMSDKGNTNWAEFFAKAK